MIKLRSPLSISCLPISVCILVKNEAANLDRCLSRLGCFADIIVQDTGSTDDSMAICAKYLATVHQETWVDFAHNRNLLFKKATQPWILWLDADEVITDTLLENIAKFVRGALAADSGAQINRMVYFQGRWIRHGHWFPNWNGRLFRSTRWTMPPRRVHESVELTEGRWKKIDGILEHYSYKNWEDLRLRSEKYAQLWAEQRGQEVKRANTWNPYIHAFWTFLKGYILKFGFLDGVLGLELALKIAKETYTKYSLFNQKMQNT